MDNRRYSLVLIVIVKLAIPVFCQYVDLSLPGKVWLSYFYDYYDDIFDLVQATFPDDNVEYIEYLYGVTWENVSFFGSTTNSNNTFQAIVFIGYESFDGGSGDGGSGGGNGGGGNLDIEEPYTNYQTYVIFNYGQLAWSTGINEGGDGNGLGGTPAQVGFNAGDGVNYFTLPGSRTNEVLDLQISSNIGIPGRWMFRVDQETIQGFSCRDEGRVGLAPSSGVMVGGTKITIIGPCYSPDSVVVCKFGDVTVAGNLVEVSLSSVEPDVSRMDPNNWLPCTNAQNTYTVTWDAASLPNTDNVDIDVIGYCEPENDSPFLTELYHAGSINDVNTNGRVFTIDCASVGPSPCGESECNKIGAIRVRSSEGTIKPAIWSDFFPLKWLCGETESCETWLQSQAEISLNSQPCPCTLAQAQRDRGRFQPITECVCRDDDPIQCLDRCLECFRPTLKKYELLSMII
ncbi:Sushi, nidogen and EGF-like domain-containing protein 1 [Holothuria leucospilota]|uniref:Sushi, nidogen and EGF-like domain-containing protein 1 n=1 Tax=Holothuria leucospilota TaxID=206669 RepID=A0A9Q1HCA8_HOLLE|nr:Sushi, nidogen and EGF-like domain-containing protein 1 [Holothuria leucospilota]